MQPLDASASRSKGKGRSPVAAGGQETRTGWRRPVRTGSTPSLIKPRGAPPHGDGGFGKPATHRTRSTENKWDEMELVPTACPRIGRVPPVIPLLDTALEKAKGRATSPASSHSSINTNTGTTGVQHAQNLPDPPGTPSHQLWLHGPKRNLLTVGTPSLDHQPEILATLRGTNGVARTRLRYRRPRARRIVRLLQQTFTRTPLVPFQSG
jgi:hypothetical protein